MPGSDLYTGTLDLLILKALQRGPRHGYAIRRWIRDRTGTELPIQEGALYPALHRLEERRLLLEAWGESKTGREAKFYRLSAAGRRYLKAEIKRWKSYAGVMTRTLAGRR